MNQTKAFKERGTPVDKFAGHGRDESPAPAQDKIKGVVFGERTFRQVKGG